MRLQLCGCFPLVWVERNGGGGAAPGGEAGGAALTYTEVNEGDGDGGVSI